MDLVRLSQMRKRLRQLQKERLVLERVGFERSEMVRASLYERQRGSYPVIYYLSTSIDGVSRDRYVRKGERVTWTRRAAAWKRFRESMARVRRLDLEIEQLLRAMGRERCVPLPKGGRWRGPPRGKEDAHPWSKAARRAARNG